MALLGLLAVGTVQAATCTSKATGNWSSTSTWKNCNSGIPLVGDTVTIASGHTVTLDADTANLNTLTITGTLDSNAGKTITVAGNVTVTGALNATTSGKALNMAVGGNLVLTGGKIKGNQSGLISVAGNMTTDATSAVDLGNGSVSMAITGNLTNNSANTNCGTGAGGFNFSNGQGILTVGGNLTNSAGACLRIGDNIPSGTSGLKVSGTTDNTGQIFANTSGAVLEFAGNLRNRSAGLITSTWGTSVVLRKDYRNDNTSFVPSNNWIFRGSVAQSITTNATTFNFKLMDLENQITKPVIIS